MPGSSPFSVPSTPPRHKKISCLTMAYTPKSTAKKHTQKHTQKERIGKSLRTPKRSPFFEFDAPLTTDSMSPFCTPEEFRDTHKSPKRNAVCEIAASRSEFSEFSELSQISQGQSDAASPHTPSQYPGLSLFLPTPQTARCGTKGSHFHTKGENLGSRKNTASLLETLRSLADSPVPVQEDISALAYTRGNGLLEAPTLFSHGSTASKNSFVCSPTQLYHSEAGCGPFLPQTPEKNEIFLPQSFDKNEASLRKSSFGITHDHNSAPHTPTHNPVIEQKPQFEPFFGSGPDLDSDSKSADSVQIVNFRDLDKIPRANIPNPFLVAKSPEPCLEGSPAIDLSTHMELIHPRTGKKFVRPLSEAEKQIKPRKLDFTSAVEAAKVPDVKIANRYLESRMGRNFGMAEPRAKGALDFEIFNDEERSV